MLVRSEQNAAHMASGYARASGRPGVCVATSGPGATNLITGIATAYMDSVPMIAVTGQVNLEQLGRDVFQEADITGACESFTKHSYLVKRATDLPVCSGRRFTSLPRDVPASADRCAPGRAGNSGAGRVPLPGTG